MLVFIASNFLKHTSQQLEALPMSLFEGLSHPPSNDNGDNDRQWNRLVIYFRISLNKEELYKGTDTVFQQWRQTGQNELTKNLFEYCIFIKNSWVDLLFSSDISMIQYPPSSKKFQSLISKLHRGCRIVFEGSMVWTLLIVTSICILDNLNTQKK